ncbi:sarcosine oxidase subunit gamma [Siccirubricoccus phaeus]|uniref:sarcosine oxidase subunit gamma n=1 Tax=Siccirubricoccus phaeus TaxID=2595053 RepID=UPI00165ACA68|nr:sarcosine oxidase subunit gamma family protein [Siccirubricoccus phaeus]
MSAVEWRRENRALVQVLARRGAEMPAFPRPGRAAAMGGMTALRVQPDGWMVMAAPEVPLLDRLRGLAGSAALVEQSDGRAVFRVSGDGARDMLARACRLDLHPRVFAVGSCASTLIAQVNVLLYQPSDSVFELLVSSTLAQHLEEWLRAASVGC